MEEFKQNMKQYAKKIGIVLEEEQIEQFYQYEKLLLIWNEKINLTAITKPEEIILKHFIDSITIAKYIGANKTLIDVGTGAGFPGIPLKIIRKDIQITIHGRVEEFGKNKKYREKFDYATSRAVANLTTLSEYLLPLVKIEEKCICMKGSTVKEEIDQSQKAIAILGGKIEEIEAFQLPESDIDRHIVLLRKIKQTPAKYPRKPGTPSKEPIL